MAITGLMQANPQISIVILSVIVTLVSTLVTKWFTNQAQLKQLKERQKEIQKELKNCKDDCVLKELQSEMLQITGTMMKSSFKPLLITMIPFLLLFYWVRSIFTPVLGFGWFWWYLGGSLVSGMIWRKILKIV